MLSTISANEYEYSSKTRQNLQLWVKSFTWAAVLLKTEKGLFHRKGTQFERPIEFQATAFISTLSALIS